MLYEKWWRKEGCFYFQYLTSSPSSADPFFTRDNVSKLTILNYYRQEVEKIIFTGLAIRWLSCPI